MGNAASVIPKKLHSAKEAAAEFGASHGRKVTVVSAAAQRPTKKSVGRETPRTAESKHDEHVPTLSQGRGDGTTAAAAAAAAAKTAGTTSILQKAESVREKVRKSLNDVRSAGSGGGRGLGLGDKDTTEGGSPNSRARDEREDVGVAQHRNSRRGEVVHSTKSHTDDAKEEKEDQRSGGDLGRRSSGGDAGSVGTASGSSGGSYTSSSYTSSGGSGSDDSWDDDASDDTFFVPQARHTAAVGSTSCKPLCITHILFCPGSSPAARTP